MAENLRHCCRSRIRFPTRMRARNSQRVNRFGQIVVGAGLHRGQEILLAVLGGQHDGIDIGPV